MVALFNGIFAPYSTFPHFWKSWMYYINPLTWFSRGVLSAALPEIVVHCAEAEFAGFDPPAGQTCAEYAGQFLRDVAMGGYLQDQNATSDCGYCAYNDGTEYMRVLNVERNDKWPCLGYMIAFGVANWCLVYFFIYTTRIKGWTFGFGHAARCHEADQGQDDLHLEKGFGRECR